MAKPKRPPKPPKNSHTRRDAERARFAAFCKRHKMPAPKKWGGPSMTIRNIEAFEGWTSSSDPY